MKDPVDLFIEDREVVLKKGGEVFYVKVGNTVIDVMHGYMHTGEKEPCAVINIYKYDHKKDKHILVYNEKAIMFSE